MGWKSNITVEIPSKSIICLAPHTSNWDFIIGILFREASGLPSYFLMKKDWFFGPFGYILKKIKGIPINRSSSQHLTDSLAEVYHERENIHICITPEGTRSLNNKWKKGFYYIALKANIPILLFCIDYKNKMVLCEKIIYPTGNIEEDFKIINDYYRQKKESAKYPRKFSVNEVF